MGLMDWLNGKPRTAAVATEAKVKRVCDFESSTNDCSLVQQLKDKQAKKREIDASIKSYDDHSGVNVEKFLALLLRMEEGGFQMGWVSSHYPSWTLGHETLSDENKRSWIARSFNDLFGVCRLETILDEMSNEDVIAIGEELKALKRRADIVCDLRRQSDSLSVEIATIKIQLGIE